MSERGQIAETPLPGRPQSHAATVALLLGILSLLLLVVWPFFIGYARLAPVVTGAAAAVVGSCALIARVVARNRPRGLWRAVVGTVAGVFSAAVYWPIMSAFLYYQELPLCPANLRGLGSALMAYHRDHGTFPPDLPTMTPLGYTVPRSYQCVLSSNSHEGRAPDYVYVAGLSPGDPGDWIVVYDPPTNHERGDAFILYVSGEVKQYRGREFAEEIERFRRAYEAARGAPPRVVGPPAQ